MIPPESTEILDAEAQLLICLDWLAEILALALSWSAIPFCARPSPARFHQARVSSP